MPLVSELSRNILDSEVTRKMLIAGRGGGVVQGEQAAGHGGLMRNMLVAGRRGGGVQGESDEGHGGLMKNMLVAGRGGRGVQGGSEEGYGGHAAGVRAVDADAPVHVQKGKFHLTRFGLT